MNEQALRMIAAVAAVGVLAYPFAAPAVASAVAWFKSSGPQKPADTIRQKMRDVETILGLSSRLSASGSKEGVDLCQKLIDVILKPSK